MIYKGKEILFPATTQVSFLKLVEKINQQQQKNDDTLLMCNASLLEKINDHPELLQGIGNEHFEEDSELVKQLCSTLFPDALRKNEIKGVIPPFEFRPFYVSERFKTILENSEEDFHFEINDFTEDQLYIYGCVSILTFYYKYPFLMSLPTLVDIPVCKGGMVRTYRLVMNGDMLEILPTEKSLEITNEDYLELLADFDNIELWKRKFLPNSWLMKGIGIVNLFDVTLDQSINKITSRLLTNTLNNLDDILEEMEKFLGVEQLSMGFLGAGNSSFLEDIHGLKNLILVEDHELTFKENLCANSYKILIEQGKPIVITDIHKWNSSSSCSVVSTIIEKLSYGSYILVPIWYKGEELGFLELASPKTYELNGSTLLKINVLLPTIAMALSRNKNEMQNRVEAIIQQECTTIHPSVKWRFEEEAVKFINSHETEENPLFKDLVFRDVYPLYGQLDIKNSSKKRNDAVNADLVHQLTLVKNILQTEWENSKIPIYEEMMYRADDYIKLLEDELLSGSEQNISFFLEKDIHPLFEQLKNKNAVNFKSITSYLKLLPKGLHTIYNQRRKYDESVFIINQALATMLDKKQKEAQEMFPHYFERYKTDGIEYNIYIGRSITQKKEFDPIFLQNIQLWQLLVTCELEREFNRVKMKQDIDLEVASLILVYSTPLSIHFRMDEKRFDVEGAYNARYEILKKRIDKAHIKGTTERITCPGKIAIVFTNDKEEATYLRYINYLEKKGYVEKNTTEVLEVENLQGLAGLKALRVTL